MGFFGRTKKQNKVAEEAAAMASEVPATRVDYKPPKPTYVELGTIDYVNLTKDGKHGEYQRTLDIAAQTGKPIFANFVEWSG